MLRCASFFAGVGGIDYGFEQTGVFETVYANEFDSYPAKTFELNYKMPAQDELAFFTNFTQCANY